jgi:hypothetical protein
MAITDSNIHSAADGRSDGNDPGDTSLDRFGHCHSLGKEHSGACFRDMAAMLMEEIAVQKEENSVQKDEIAILANANAAAEISDTERQPLLEPTSIAERSSGGAQLQGPPPSPPCFCQSA